MKQLDMFGDDEIEKVEARYTKKATTPIYEPAVKCPDLIELLDDSKTKRLVREIQQSNVSDAEKQFLINAAQRHLTFQYKKVADYYAHATPEMQSLMERSALVIIDFTKAIQYGYVRLAEDITQQYLKDYDVK